MFDLYKIYVNEYLYWLLHEYELSCEVKPNWSMLKLGFLFVGFMGTNTSNEIEALHKALREVGLSPTIKNDSQGLDSSMANNTDLLQKILSTEPEKGEKIHLILYAGKYLSLFYLPVCPFYSPCRRANSRLGKFSMSAIIYL